MKNSRRVWVGAMLTAAALSVAGCAGSAAEPEDDSPITVGFIAPFSGPYEIYGEQMKRTFDLYLETHDGELGGRPVEVVEGDEAAGGNDAVAAAQRLVNEEGLVAVTGMASSGSATAAAQVFDTAGVPLLVSVAGPDNILGPDSSDYIWKVGGLTARQSAYALGKWTAESDPSKDVFAIMPEYSAGHEIVEAYNLGSTESGGDGLIDARFYPLGSTTDFQPYLSALVDSGAAELYSMPAGSAVPFLEQFRQFTSDIPLSTTGAIWGSAQVLDAVGDEALDIADSYYYSWTLDNPLNSEFVAAYEEAYGEKPTGEGMGQWEAMVVLDNAIASIEGEVTSEAIVEALKNLGEVETPAGTYSLDPETHMPTRPVGLFVNQSFDGGIWPVYTEELAVVGFVPVG